VTAERCPACGHMADIDHDDTTGAGRWSSHPASTEQRIGEEQHPARWDDDEDPPPPPTRDCATSWLDVRLVPPAAEPAGESCPWPSSAMKVTLALARFWYSLPHQSTGGIYHVVLDDGNIEAHFVEHCRDEAITAGYELGIELGQRLMGLTYGQRWWVYRALSEKAWLELGVRAYQVGWTIANITDPMIRGVLQPHVDRHGHLPHDFDFDRDHPWTPAEESPT